MNKPREAGINGGKSDPQKKSRDYRLDLVKAVSISLVLLLHLRPLRIVVDDATGTHLKDANFILDQLYLNSTLLAVPLFFLTSLFLFFQKLQVSEGGYLKKRCNHLLQIFVFWMSFHLIFYYLVSLFTSLKLSVPFSWNIPGLRFYKLIAGVDPPLPIVGDSVFYFLFNLILLIILSHFFYQIRERHKDIIGIVIVVLSIIYFEYLSLIGENLEYWRIDNFIVYIPISYFLVKYGENVAAKYSFLLGLGFLVFGVQDIILRSVKMDIGFYGRVSVVCGATFLFVSFLNLNLLSLPRSAEFLSNFSLGIFALHKYWLFLISISVSSIFQLFNIATVFQIIGLDFDLPAIFSAIFTLLFTFICVVFLAKSPLRKFVK